MPSIGGEKSRGLCSLCALVNFPCGGPHRPTLFLEAMNQPLPSLDQFKRPYWRNKRLTPAQLLVHDISEQPQTNRLRAQEVLSSTLLPQVPDDILDKSIRNSATLPAEAIGRTSDERGRLENRNHLHGWLSLLRLPEHDEDERLCRWIHISSKVPDYLEAAFHGLSDWSIHPSTKLEKSNQLERCLKNNERWSRHGKFYTPFFDPLSKDRRETGTDNVPLILSVPFLDWTVYPGPTPPLRFQVDERAQWTSTRSAVHPLRSILQHYYRLEETTDRERSQVLTKHRPWSTDREVDLKTRRFYGHYPSGLVADEFWMLVIDSRHIVTFSSNQSWKSRWPPLQLSARIAEISLRSIRTERDGEHEIPDYDAFSHAAVCLHGAVGLLHRSFWHDMPLPLIDRYSGYLSHLQYRLYRSPSTKLVMDLLQLQDELMIALQISKAQEQILTDFDQYLLSKIAHTKDPSTDAHESLHRQSLRPRSVDRPVTSSALRKSQATISEVMDKLRREVEDLTELRVNTNELVNRTVQLVNIRIEDHGQAILVFTLVTVIFLPLSFLSSFFGMNTVDIRNTTSTQAVFWIAAAALTVTVVGMSSFLAFYGGRMMEMFVDWKDAHNINPNLNLIPDFTRFRRRTPQRPPVTIPEGGFTILDTSHI